MKSLFPFLLLIFGTLLLPAQVSLPLNDMTSFRDQAGNWMIVGDVVIDPYIDIHAQPEPLPPPEASTKKGKKKKNLPPVVVVAPPPPAVTHSPGTGILLNMNDDKIRDNLLTAWEHGDIELELEVMIPKGSNSGIYLQGRYEVQLLDSWGVRQPGFGDIGGIYRNWENAPGKIYRGKAPLSNPAKAPGLWQKIHLLFMAPRFDAAGNKTANARFVYVDLNGLRIHHNVEVPLPTGGPVQNNEVARGPLMIQGDHGPVAFRNIRYRMMSETEASLKDLRYKTFSGVFQKIDDFQALKPESEGSSPTLDCGVLEPENDYALIYTGKLAIPKTDTYTLTFAYTGGAVLRLDGKTLFDVQSPTDSRREKTTLTLQAGEYPIEIYNYKTAGWHPPRLGLYIEGSSAFPLALHAYDSYPETGNMRAPIHVDAGSRPRLLRAFLDFKGDRSQRLTHTLGVGDPGGVHYVFDLDRGLLACGWRGDFIDATPMWNDRGDGSFRPRGAAQYTFISQPLAVLESVGSPFPEVEEAPRFRAKGYSIEKASGRPVFRYLYQGMEVSSRIYPSEKNTHLVHEVFCAEADSTENLYYKLAEGSKIEQMPNGDFAVNDREYFLKVRGDRQPQIRTQGNKQELIIRMDEPELVYELIW